MTNTAYALFLLTDGMKKEDIFPHTGCTAAECNLIWEEIQKVREQQKNDSNLNAVQNDDLNSSEALANAIYGKSIL